MKKFKKVYIEITNICNLKCNFCIGNKRKKKFMNLDQFKIILNKIKPYTDYLYFHILGEPCMHPDINLFIEYAYKNGFKINITTNGYLIDRIKKFRYVRQVNISLHSYNIKYNINLEDYLNNIFKIISTNPNTYFSLRLWTNNNFNNTFLKYISSKYNIKIDTKNFNNVKISDNIFLSQSHEFIWPDLNNNYYKESGKCYGLIDHFGILVDGTIVPCCLDSLGCINLGNIYNDSLDEIFTSKRAIKMVNGFKNNYKNEELCRHCNFLNKKKEI